LNAFKIFWAIKAKLQVSFLFYNFHQKSTNILLILLISFIIFYSCPALSFSKGRDLIAPANHINQSITISLIEPGFFRAAYYHKWAGVRVQESDKVPLSELLHQFLVKNIGMEKLTKLEAFYQPRLESEAFDLYLLNFWLKGKFLEALTLINLKLKESPTDFWLLEQAGAFLYSLNQPELAYNFFQLANQYFPQNPTTLNNLGVTAYRLNGQSQAAQFFSKAIELDPYQPEANQALFLIYSSSWPQEKVLPYLINSLKGSYRESLSSRTKTTVLPLASQQELYISLPPLPADFLHYQNLTSFYQEAMIKLDEGENELRKKLEAILSSVSKNMNPEVECIPAWHLKSTSAYSRLLELNGRLDQLEREVEQPIDIELEKIISSSISKLESIFDDYAREEKSCLEIPRSERPDCLKKARDNYCRRYREQIDYFYQRYRTALENYLGKAEAELKNFLKDFYFWVKYLPDDQQKRQRIENELRAWKIYQRFWEKAFQLLTRLGQPAFPDCLPAPSLKPETNPEPIVSFSDPYSGIKLSFNDETLNFDLQPSGLWLKDSLPETDLRGGKNSFPFTIYLFPPESIGTKPLYLTFDQEGQLGDLGEITPSAFSGLNPYNQWRILISLCLLIDKKTQ